MAARVEDPALSRQSNLLIIDTKMKECEERKDEKKTSSFNDFGRIRSE